MKTSRPLSPYPSITTHIFIKGFILAPNFKRVSQFPTSHVKFPLTLSSSYVPHSRLSATRTSSNVVAHDVKPDMFHAPLRKNSDKLEENIEKVIYGCRFLAILAVWGSLLGSLLCFVKGCTYIAAAFQEYMVNRAKVIMFLVEAIVTFHLCCYQFIQVAIF
ncbi:hypothetical protein Leryth_013235 [Lithospermum erythrorhizon]|nr:hypothetical protein Leryth_013235 [Lithospermum erythrorhizon]